MDSIKEKSAIIFGESGFSIICMEHLLSRRWQIKAVVTRDQKVIDWCKEKSIDSMTVTNINQIKYNYCYIFSIDNLHIISSEFINRTKAIKAINYHNGPLPKYAGLNATIWAILNNEKHHGITWHEIIPGIDEGDIFYQICFELDENETAFSLNLKCTEEGIEGFKKVISDIENNCLKSIKQNLEQKTYYGNDNVIPNFGYLSTNDHEINSTLNALYFGDLYQNPMACAKVKIGNDYYILEKNNPFEKISEINTTSCRFKSLYGKQIEFDENHLALAPVRLSKQQMNFVIQAAKEEFKYDNFILKLTRTHEQKTGIFCGKFDDELKEPITIKIPNTQNISFDYFKAILQVIFTRLATNKLLIKVYEKNDISDNFLKMNFEIISFLAINPEDCDKSFGDLIDHKVFTLSKDFFYRHHTEFSTEISISHNNDIQTDSHRIKIIYNENTIQFFYYSIDEENINIICNCLTHLLSCETNKLENKKIKDISLLNNQDYFKVMHFFNQTEKDYFLDTTLHEQFESQVAKSKDQIAATFENSNLTYQNLNSKANTLAYYLRIQYKLLDDIPDSLVAIAIDRGMELLISFIGVLKAGAAYIPIEVNYPEKRIKYILEDSRPQFLITTTSLAPLFKSLISENDQIKLILIDDLLLKSQNEQELNPVPLNKASHLAYVIYTSGSTGFPKGTLISHRAVVNTILAGIENYRFNSHSRVLQSTSCGFDNSIIEYFCTLLSGGNLILTKQENLLPGEPLKTTLLENKITLFNTTPSALSHLPKQEYPDLKTIIIGGEGSSLELIKHWSKYHHLINAYGCTECAIDSSYYVCHPDDNIVTIGKPIANTKMYVLDEYLQPVPISFPGQLYIAGANLARGYLNRASLTHERFIRNPHTENHSLDYDQLYKTGDIVRWLPDGNIQFLGRNDDQVKIRGFRIQLEEIEIQLRNHSEVKNCAVLLKSSEQNKFIVAFIVMKELQLHSESLREFLKKRLPHYMIPSTFIQLNQLPITPNGKIDRKKLLEITIHDHNKEVLVLAENSLERSLASIWQDALKINSISMTDNFFELGGHSLLAVKVVTDTEKILGKKIPLKAIFQFSTIRDMANLILQNDTMILNTPSKYLSIDDYRKLLVVLAGSNVESTKPGSLIAVMNRNGTKPPIFWCTNGFWGQNKFAQFLGDARPLYLMLSGLKILGIKHTSNYSVIKNLASYYVAEILTIQPAGSLLIGGTCVGARVALEIALQLLSHGREIKQLYLLEFFDPQLYHYPSQMHLTFSQKSPIDPRKIFQWGKLGWKNKFKIEPIIAWIPGEHKIFRDESQIADYTQLLNINLKKIEKIATNISFLRKYIDRLANKILSFVQIFSLNR